MGIARKRSISVSSFIYYLVFGFYLLYSTLTGTMLGQAEWILKSGKFIVLICSSGIILKFLVENRFRVRECIIACIMLGITVLVFIYMDDYFPFFLILFMYGARKCDARMLAKIYLLCTGGIVLLATILSQIGIIEDRLFYRDNGLLRHSMGMTYVTIWAGVLFSIIAVYIYLRHS